MQLDRQKPHSIVTGDAGGIGTATVRQFASRGHQVTCCDLAAHPDSPVNSTLVDVANVWTVKAVVHRVGQRYGTVTDFVARQGIRGAFVLALELGAELLREHYDIHGVGTFNVTRQIAALLDGAAASIVFVSSTTANSGWTTMSN